MTPSAPRQHSRNLRFTHRSPAVSITSAPLSPDQEYSARRRRYATLMTIRIACVIAAVSVSSFSLLLALALMAGGAVLPWCAVLIANDRLPIEHAGQRKPIVDQPRAITAPQSRTIEL